MNLFHCDHCQAQVYFDNNTCLGCGAVLAFLPGELNMAGFVLTAETSDGTPEGFHARLGAPEGEICGWRPCVHRHGARACNWAVAVDDPNPECPSCRLTVIAASAPELDQERRWYAVESAKRRLLHTLLSLGIPLRPKASPDDWTGLAFVWQVPESGQQVVTGHHNGTITLNLAEADDDQRESARVAFNEPLRTVLGHLRHEISHYLDMRFVDSDAALASEFTQLMGDKQRDYKAALNTYYAQGAPTDWQKSHISAYASAHPWEDWAETCAHYLLIVDAVETAAAWGLRLDNAPEAQDSQATGTASLSAKHLVLQYWLPVSRFLNGMARSIGLRDSYPFVIEPTVLTKLDFVQRVLQAASTAPTDVLQTPHLPVEQPSPTYV